MTEINIIIPNDSKVNNDEENETLIVNEDYFEQEDSQKSEEEGIISNEDKVSIISCFVPGLFSDLCAEENLRTRLEL